MLITGAAGNVATLLRSRMIRADRLLRLVDIAEISAAGPGERVEILRGSVTDLEEMTSACVGVDAVVHLAALSTEHPWAEVLLHNIHGSYVVFEAARRAGVSRVVFASSAHAVGFHPNDGKQAPDYLSPRPDTFYGLSKATGEALGSLYHDRYGLDVICLRIGGCFPRPLDTDMLASWLSPDDAARLVEAALSAPSPGFRVVWGISANTRRWWSLHEARSLGYHPRDDSERHAHEIPTGSGQFDTYLGGWFCSPELDAPDPGWQGG
ncbi:NAD-dependent epimerase/dehydratase family protein [Nocardia sp. NPDC051570]|uniref:NAD-dependent epimerase/dehydratase family protein n=1 Tax=Nocardia sp. NPDC051570 TaxID=3364324 RepID=UPI00378A97F8